MYKLGGSGPQPVSVTLGLSDLFYVEVVNGLAAGDSIALEVPPGTQSGHVARARGRGLPGLRGGHGDLLARIQVWVPSRVGAAERRLLEELARAESFKPPRPSKPATERTHEPFAR